MAPHLFVDISSHGLGHLAQVAPILNELGNRLANLRATVRCGLSNTVLRARLKIPFTHIQESTDFGFVMLDAVRVDHAHTAAVYREQHANWMQLVHNEADWLRRLKPDLVLSDVSYLALAGAARAGIPSLAMCSLNWAELFTYFFGGQSWADPIHDEMLNAYRSAKRFLRLIPAMPMNDLPNRQDIAPVAALGRDCRLLLRERLDCRPGEKLLLIAFGGFDIQLPVERWPRTEGVRWLIPESWAVDRHDMVAFEPLGFHFTDLLRSVDAVFTKPGYGIFTEAACNGTPVLFLRRDDWPEQGCLIEWLQRNARCHEIDEAALIADDLKEVLDALWRQSTPPLPIPAGANEAASLLSKLLAP